MIVPLTMALAGIAVLATMSAIAYRRIAPGKSRLAMRWNLRGEPTWSLPRKRMKCRWFPSTTLARCHR